MADFGKMNFSVSFNPTSAFPLDARYYFSTLTAAQEAAGAAVEVGSSDGTYFIGQNLVVVEESKATLYVIQPDKSLKEVGSTPVGDDKSITVSPEGTISLVGLTEAATGAYPSKGADGSIQWVKPDTTTVEGLSQTVETLGNRTQALETTVGNAENGLVKDVNDVKTNLTKNYYNKSEVDQKVAGAFHFRGKAHKFEGGEIYTDESTVLEGMKEGDVYQVADKEYAYSGIEWVELGFNIDLSHLAEKTLVSSTAEQTLENAKAYADTKVGEIDLSPYAKTTEVEAKVAAAKTEAVTTAVEQAKGYTDETTQPLIEQLGQKVDKVVGSRLMTDAEGTKLNGIEAGAQVNVINSVEETELQINPTGKKLSIKAVDKSKVTGLDTTLIELTNKIDEAKGIADNAIKGVKVNGVALEVDVTKSIDIPLATATKLGVVKGSDAENKVTVNDNGEMEVHSLNVGKLTQTEGQVLILNGGTSETL